MSRANCSRTGDHEVRSNCGLQPTAPVTDCLGKDSNALANLALGYAGLTEREIREGIRRLAKAIGPRRRR